MLSKQSASRRPWDGGSECLEKNGMPRENTAPGTMRPKWRSRPEWMDPFRARARSNKDRPGTGALDSSSRK